MFTPYNAGSFSNFTTYSGEEDLMFPSSVSPASFPDDDEGGDAVERSIAAAKKQQAHEDGGIVANSYPLDNSQLLPLPPSSGVIPARTPSTSPSAPPVYDPMISPIPSQQQQQQPYLPRTTSSPHANYGLPPSLTPPSSRDTEEPYVEIDDEDRYDAASLTLTPEERRRLQKLLEVQQKKERGASKRPSYWERVWGRRRDIGKLVMLAFVILFALAVHAAAVHYISLYIDSAGDDLSFWIELALRVGYPILVLIALWALKLHVSSPSASSEAPQVLSQFRPHRRYHHQQQHRRKPTTTSPPRK